MSISFINITDLNDRHTEQAFVIYNQSFPANERQKEDLVRQRITAGIENLIVGLNGDEVVAMGLVFTLLNSEFVLLDYFAVSEQSRGAGTGTQFMQHLLQHYYQADKQVLLEVEDPSTGVNLAERIRRVNFYRRLGAKSLQGVYYIIPALDGTTPTKMVLMLCSKLNIFSIAGSEVKKLLLKLYKQVYNKNADDSPVLDVIQQLPDTVKLQ